MLKDLELPKHIQNPRITYDGKYWYLSYSYEVEEKDIIEDFERERIGIDLGIKDIAIISTGEHYCNINKGKEIRRLRKRLKRIQKQISRKYEANATIIGGKKVYHKSNNIKKLEIKVRHIYRRISNIQKTHMYEVIKAVMKTKPQSIVLEDLNIKGMLQNPKLAKSIQEQNLSRFRQILTYKCKLKGIKLYIADRWYPSSKLCSVCGNIKGDLKLSERTYCCDNCGSVIDRDLNAAINLENCPEDKLKRVKIA